MNKVIAKSESIKKNDLYSFDGEKIICTYDKSHKKLTQNPSDIAWKIQHIACKKEKSTSLKTKGGLDL